MNVIIAHKANILADIFLMIRISNTLLITFEYRFFYFGPFIF